jgi:hypothetical protein
MAEKKPKDLAELSEAAKQDVSRAEALNALYGPRREDVEAELEKTESGRKLLEETHALGKELGELYESIRSGKTPYEDGKWLARQRQDEFRERNSDQLDKTHALYAHLQPSAEAVAQILRPDIATDTTWVSETSRSRSMLMQPKQSPEGFAGGSHHSHHPTGTVQQGLGDPPPAFFRSVGPSYDLNDAHSETFLLGTSLPHTDLPTGTATTEGNCASILASPVGVSRGSAFVGHDFAVPQGPTLYTTTITYTWHCFGGALVELGFAVVNVDLAIVIDKRDGTRDTHAREVSLFSMPPPFGGVDGFNHFVNAEVTIPFTRDGSNGTVRIMVGPDAHCVTNAAFAQADFFGSAVVHKISIESP